MSNTAASSSYDESTGAFYRAKEEPSRLSVKVALRRKGSAVPESQLQWVTVRWQKKIFGPREVLRYLSGDRRPTECPMAEEFDAQRERRLKAGKTSPPKGSTIFTTLNAERTDRARPSAGEQESDARDEETADHEGDGPCTRSERLEPGRLRHGLLREDEEDGGSAVCMWVMAAVAREGNSASNGGGDWEGTEHVLARIRYDRTRGVLELRPGLNTPDNPWHQFRAGPADGRDVFEYQLKPASSCEAAYGAVDTEEQEAFDFARVESACESGAPPVPLAPPPPEDHHGVTRLLALGEIMSATGLREGAGGSGWIASSAVSLEYWVELPDGWASVASDSSCLSSWTHSACDQSSDPPALHFSHPFELMLDSPASSCCSAEWPLIHIVAHAVGSWRRHAVLGYGHALLPRYPGRHSVSVPLWRPLPTIRSRLREYYLGGSSELADTSYEALPSPALQGASDTRRARSKFGLKSEHTGQVHLRFHCALQTWPEDSCSKETEDGKSRKRGGRKAAYGKQAETAAINSALERVRQRVENLKNAQLQQPPANTM